MTFLASMSSDPPGGLHNPCTYRWFDWVLLILLQGSMILHPPDLNYPPPQENHQCWHLRRQHHLSSLQMILSSNSYPMIVLTLSDPLLSTISDPLLSTLSFRTLSFRAIRDIRRHFLSKIWQSSLQPFDCCSLCWQLAPVWTHHLQKMYRTLRL